MNKSEIIAFFDEYAPGWDDHLIKNESIICRILDNAGDCAGKDVLDVACGTGVLFPDYYERGAATVTGIDFSPEMAKRARAKYPDTCIICEDVEEYPFDRQFDLVMVYNAFPHFPDPESLIRRLAALVKPGGRLSVAHSMSKEQMKKHHAGRSRFVSIELLDEQVLADIFKEWFDVDIILADEQMYQVAGTKK